MKISAENERKLSAALLKGLGMASPEAETVAEVITHSDLTGVYSHGMSRLAVFLKQLICGGMNPKPQMRLLHKDGASLSYDCDNGSGIAAANKVYEELVPLAREYGVAIGTGMRSANIGCGSYYALKGAKEGLITLMCCNTYLLMAPYGGVEALLGTNPIIVGVPAGEELPVILDMATTQVAMGKIAYARREGIEIPDTWGKDENGLPVTDAAKVSTLQPIAGYKGYGLAVMVDMLAAVLSGACFGRDVGNLQRVEPENTGFGIILIDPSRFMPMDKFKARVDGYVRMMKESRKSPGTEEIYLPGELELKKYDRSLDDGVELGTALVTELELLSVKAGLASEGEALQSIVERL